MNAFTQLNLKIDSVIETQTEKLTTVILESDIMNDFDELDHVNRYYDEFMNSAEENVERRKHYASNLARLKTTVSGSLVAINNQIRPFFEAYMKSHGNFNDLFTIMTNFSLKLMKSKLALAIGCAQENKELNITKDRSDEICGDKNYPGYERIDFIFFIFKSTHIFEFRLTISILYVSDTKPSKRLLKQ